jgi:hypothetical protein
MRSACSGWPDGPDRTGAAAEHGAVSGRKHRVRPANDRSRTGLTVNAANESESR